MTSANSENPSQGETPRNKRRTDCKGVGGSFLEIEEVVKEVLTLRKLSDDGCAAIEAPVSGDWSDGYNPDDDESVETGLLRSSLKDVKKQRIRMVKISAISAVGLFLTMALCRLITQTAKFPDVNKRPHTGNCTATNKTILPHEESYICILNSRDAQCCTPQECAAVRNSTLYSGCCGNVLEQKSRFYPLLITSTPRSGTVFMYNLLNALNISVANDANKPKRHGMVSWVHIFKDDNYETGYVRAKDLHGSKFASVWHQVRDPLKTLTSIAFTEPLGEAKYLKYISRHILLSNTKTKYKTKSKSKRLVPLRITRALEFYLQWHDFLDELHLPIIRLESLVENNDFSALDNVFRSIRQTPPDHSIIVDWVDRMRRQRQRRRTNVIDHNHRDRRDTLKWEELCEIDVALTRRFLVKSQKYGYYHNISCVCDD